jgi:hypothetical protein
MIAALDEAMKVHEHFPSVAELRHLADEVQEFVLKAQKVLPPQHDPHVETYHCPNCRDTGWYHGLVCTLTDRCGMKSCVEKGDENHTEHTYSVKCRCHANNPVYAARFKEKQTFYEDKRLKRRGFSHSD